MVQALIVGRPVLLVIDFQQTELDPDSGIPVMEGYEDCVERASRIVEAARKALMPVIFTQERHSRTLVDFGRELDGAERLHCVEDDPGTELVPELTPQQDELLVVKRRYSAFFGTDLEILLRGLTAETLLVCGGLTDVCVHYTFVDAHQHDYHVRVAVDALFGSSRAAHEAALRAMEYLQSEALSSSESMIRAIAEYAGPHRPPVQPGKVRGRDSDHPVRLPQ
jgi:biuret amidohydrolase